MTDIILWFDQLCKDDIETAGGKGANLGELTNAGICVPPGFVVTAPTYQEFVIASGLRDQISSLLSGIEPSNMQALQMASQQVKQLIEPASLPDTVASNIKSAYGKLGGGPVAVRSSATAEDLPDASFAGQQSTFLNVVGAEHVVHAVKACWASLFEPHAIAYRAKNGYDHLECAIAVPVQSMVQSERSGVMFTVNPVTKQAGQIIIEAAYGLGEAVVSGMVTPDMFIVDKASLTIVDCTVSEQEQELVRDPDGEPPHANMWRDVPVAIRGAQKLTDAQAVELAKLGVRVEQHYGSPQDIEWAIEGGAMYLLQARPITTL